MTASTLSILNPMPADTAQARGRGNLRAAVMPEGSFEQTLANVTLATAEVGADGVAMDGNPQDLPAALTIPSQQGLPLTGFVIQALNTLASQQTENNSAFSSAGNSGISPADGSVDPALYGVLQMLQLITAPALHTPDVIQPNTLTDNSNSAEWLGNVQTAVSSPLVPQLNGVETDALHNSLQFAHSAAAAADVMPAMINETDAHQHVALLHSPRQGEAELTTHGADAGQSTLTHLSALTHQGPSSSQETLLIKAGNLTIVQDSIPNRFGSPHWSEAVGQKVLWMIGREQQTATLTLNPPDLGPLQVVVAVHQNQADTIFVAQNPEVRQALQDGLENLRYMMHQAGIQLGQTQVQDERQPQQSWMPAYQAPKAETASDNAQCKAVPAHVHVSNGLVDTFV